MAHGLDMNCLKEKITEQIKLKKTRKTFISEAVFPSQDLSINIPFRLCKSRDTFSLRMQLVPFNKLI
jgi:hypothetical protein